MMAGVLAATTTGREASTAAQEPLVWLQALAFQQTSGQTLLDWEEAAILERGLEGGWGAALLGKWECAPGQSGSCGAAGRREQKFVNHWDL